MFENSENTICQNCKCDFTIEPEDFNFYKKIKVPPPTFCPTCRIERRMVYRNERYLYKRKCDLCNEEKILVYPKDSPFKVYCFNCFSSDKWDGSKWQIKFDFSRSFFEQYTELYKDIPRSGNIKQGFNINSEYTNRVTDLKNCYLIFASVNNENCYYGVSYWDSRDSMDCYNIRKCERCYECIDCYSCNGLKYSKECNSCINSFFLQNCRNCQECFGCMNLRNKSYCIFNQQYSREDYFFKISEFKFSNNIELNEIQERINKESLKYIVPSFVEYHSTNVSGNWIENSKNIQSSFNCDNVEDGKYLFGITDAKDVMDYTYWGKSSELIYEANSIGRQCSSVFFSSESWDGLMNSEYCINCFSSSNLFGCVGLRNKSYCILNTQYSKEEYLDLVSKIKEQMQKIPFINPKGKIYKYGEFFPIDLSPFGYNETIAQEYFPKTKEQALAEGYKWKDPEKKNYKPTILSTELPLNINLVNIAINNIEIIKSFYKQQLYILFDISDLLNKLYTLTKHIHKKILHCKIFLMTINFCT